MSDIFLKALRESESAVYNNYDVNYTINEYTHLIEACETTSDVLRFTPEMVPIFKMKNMNLENTYCIDGELFNKLIKENNVSVKEAIESLYNEIGKENEISSVEEMAIVMKYSSPDALYEAVMADPSKINARCALVQESIDLIKSIQETGCKILIK